MSDTPKRPRGRPVGSKSKFTSAMNEAIAGDLLQFRKMALANARDPGNEHQLNWAQICKGWGAQPRSTMPNINVDCDSLDIKDHAKAIALAMVRGRIPPDVAQSALSVIRDALLAVDMADLEALIDKALSQRGLEVA
ncbi:hypothetical protein EZV61_03480 [Corallincola luteus]|uniref:Uncharacterized protein n=1 Tax=Corallincola luteus TaxID=1775177 RepID=A0ABY2ARJ3_9GAMM|nr:hypothetical protein [Corallincola luteus]TCI05038.1 hypothetical protein EZV61_03480 [Corallincola luteus]